MYAEERQQAIAARAIRDGRVEVSALALEFGVTSETIRRDLTALEQRQVVRRVHGGAIHVERLAYEPALAQRNQTMTAEKERIAKAALDELPTEGSILLDAGTTTARLAEILPADRTLTVITNAVPIASSLSTRPHIMLMVVGGRVRGQTAAAVDGWALGALEVTTVDVAFMGTNGISVARGLTTPDPAEAAVKRAMIRAARRVVVLADHTKFDDDTLMRFGSLDEVDTVITDAGLSDEATKRLEEAGPRVVRA
jgi:DeoR family transcriptional regulator, fructose operon transcriptional repressor